MALCRDCVVENKFFVVMLDGISICVEDLSRWGGQYLYYYTETSQCPAIVQNINYGLIIGIVLALVMVAIMVGFLIFWLLKRRWTNPYRQLQIDRNGEGFTDRDRINSELENAHEEIRVETVRLRDLEEQFENRERNLYRALRDLSLQNHPLSMSDPGVQRTHATSTETQSGDTEMDQNKTMEEINTAVTIDPGSSLNLAENSHRSIGQTENPCDLDLPTNTDDLNLSKNIFGDLDMQPSTSYIQPLEPSQNQMQNGNASASGFYSQPQKELRSPDYIYEINTEAEFIKKEETTETENDDFGSDGSKSTESDTE